MLQLPRLASSEIGGNDLDEASAFAVAAAVAGVWGLNVKPVE